MYDPETNKWKYMREMNKCRLEAAAAVVNEKIFCCGGFNGKDNLDSVECYDPSSDVWALICNMPQMIWGHGAAAIGGNFIIMGGYSREHLNNVWALDTTDKNAGWIEKPCMSTQRSNFSIAKIHDKIFVWGGKAGPWISVKFWEIFDGEVWRGGPNMPTSRWDAPAVVIPMEFARSLN